MSALLITGGTGFIGARLAQRCHEAGDEVTVLAQCNTDAERRRLALLEQAGIRCLIGSVTDSATVDAALEGQARVIHLAAAQHEAGAPDAHFMHVNAEGTALMVERARDHGVDRFVHGSTIGVWGAANSTLIDSHTPLLPDNIYGQSKLAGEHELLTKRGALDAVIMRISETYGPGDQRLLKLYRAIRSGRFFLIGDGQNLHPLIHVDDLIDGLLLASHGGGEAGGIYLLAGQRPISTREMVDTIAEVMGVSPPSKTLPLTPFTLAAHASTALCKLLRIDPPLHPRRLNFFDRGFAFAPELLEAMPGFRAQRSFADGARETAEWYSQQGWL